MERVDITIIGAGVVGLAIASQIARKEKSVYIIEKNDSFGKETSSRNSEVIHAGIYYPKDSLKAVTCVEGSRLLYEICRKNDIPYKKTGKLIVAVNDSEIDKLKSLFEQGTENGVEGLRIISKDELKRLEPAIEGIAALHSPNTGILDSHRLMKYFLFKAKDNGAEIAYNSEVYEMEKIAGGYKITIRNNTEEFSFISRIVINSAGLNSDLIAQKAGIDIKKDNYELKYCKGQYFRIKNNRHSIKHLIYPVPAPEEKGLGVHLTLSLDGAIRLGPDAVYIDRENFDYTVDISQRDKFYTSAKKFLHSLKPEDIIPDTSGIRPKLQGQTEDFRDFIIKDEKAKGLPGFINLIGIESPGLTASVSIAKYVEHIIKNKP